MIVLMGWLKVDRVCCMQVLLEFPIEVLSALVAGRWAASASAARPFLAGYKLRLGMAAIVTAMARSLSCVVADARDAPALCTSSVKKLCEGRPRIILCMCPSGYAFSCLPRTWTCASPCAFSL